MTITPQGQAIILSKDGGQRFVINASELDWDQVSAEERQMGPELQYFGKIEHPILGYLTWSAWEYPVGMLNDLDNDINGHTLEQNFSFDPEFQDEENWDSSENVENFSQLSNDQLRALPAQEQQEHMVAWFHSQFWDPAQETPYNGREGGYQYIYGGPYEAREELEEKFGGVVNDTIIESAVDDIEADGTYEWAPSPSHPDQLSAAEEYYESLRPQTFQEIESALSNGVAINFDTLAARSAAEQLKKSSEELIAALDDRRPKYGEIGHNGPAVDDEGNILPDGFEHELRETATALTVQMDAETPDPEVVLEAATRLQRLRAWLKPRVDLAADEFAKEIGKAVAKGVVIAAGTFVLTLIVPGLDAVIGAALNWLIAILA